METKNVSIHGGHSGEFCLHASDTLEEIIQAYIRSNFSWVGITEHIPAISDKFLYPDEIHAGLTVEKLRKQFSAYFTTLRVLKKKYARDITILTGFETETCGNYIPYINTLRKTYKPDFIVGSVHHVNEICFDYSQEYYLTALKKSGNIETLYMDYFDAQYNMIGKLKPEVIGHFDLIRIYDPDYDRTLKIQKVKDTIVRNLELIKTLNLTLDFNTRALFKNAKEPYISRSLLELIKEMNIRLLPGDDSHSAAQAGLYIKEGVTVLEEMGFKLNFDPDLFIKK